MKCPVDELMEMLNEPCGLVMNGPHLRAMAASPSTRLDLLEVLLQVCPTQVLGNPAFRLAMATDSGLIGQLGVAGQAAIAGCETADPQLIRRLAARRTRSARCRMAAAANPSCPPDMLWDYLRHRRPVRVALAGNPALPDALIAAILEDTSWQVREQIAMRPSLSEAFFSAVAGDADWHVRRSLAKNERLPKPIMHALVTDPYYRVREQVAARQDLAPDLLAAMAAREQGHVVLSAVITNPSTPEDALGHLTADLGSQVATALYRRQEAR